MQRLFIFFALMAMLAGNARAEPPPVRILVMGDSLLAAHKLTGRNVGGGLRRMLRADVTDTSVAGARFLYRLPITGALGLNIAKQYRKGEWDWIVLNGGGNDIWMGCGCRRCERRIGRLVGKTGRTGAIPHFVARLRNTGARVIVTGYLRTPGIASPIESCADEGDLLEQRLIRMADYIPGVYYVSNVKLVPHGDSSFHGVDRVHPSIKGSAAIARNIARTILKAR